MTKLGAYTVPIEPEAGEYQVEDLPIAGSRRALDGTLNTTFAAMKRRWRVTWSGLTAAQRDSLMAETRKAQHLAWTPYEGSSYTVRVLSAHWVVTRDARAHYSVTVELEQV